MLIIMSKLVAILGCVGKLLTKVKVVRLFVRQKKKFKIESELDLKLEFLFSEN